VLRILVAGGAGLIGAQVFEALLARDEGLSVLTDWGLAMTAPARSMLKCTTAQ
jgi:nucleoside-diphosphate-sugar epimerase